MDLLSEHGILDLINLFNSLIFPEKKSEGQELKQLAQDNTAGKWLLPMTAHLQKYVHKYSSLWMNIKALSINKNIFSEVMGSTVHGKNRFPFSKYDLMLLFSFIAVLVMYST